MTYDIYRYIFFGGAGLAVLCLAIAAILFFVFKIPSVIGDLTGSTARKAIENIRNQNESTGKKAYKSSAVNKQRGKLTEKMTDSGNTAQAPDNPMGVAMATSKISTTRLETEALESYETSLLENGSAETTVLGASAETTVLDGFAETTVLNQQAAAFEIEYELTFIHTDEVIA